MALITTIEEIKNFVAIGEGNYLEQYSAALDGVEQNEIIPVLSQAQFDALQAAYTADNGEIADQNLATLLLYVQRALSNLAIAESLDFGQVRITANGLTRTEKDTEKTAYHYQKIEAQEYLYKQGYQAIEGLLGFLEINKDNYTAWRDSEAYTLSQRFFITSAADFQLYYNINRSRRTFQALAYLMERKEGMVLEELLGVAFMDDLKTRQRTGNLSADESYLLKRYIKPALANLTVAAAAYELGVQLTERGMVMTSRTAGQGNEEKKPASGTSLEMAASRAENNGQSYLHKMQVYLNGKASETVFALYYDSDRRPGEFYQPAGQTAQDPGKPIYNAL